MKRILLTVILVLTSLWAESTKYATYSALYQNKEYTKAFAGFQKLARDEKNVDAAYMLAYMYEHAQGCDENKTQALKWYSFAAKKHYDKDKYIVDKEITKYNDTLYDSLSAVSNPVTQHTIHQYLYSMFNIKAYKTNYIIPLSMRVNGNYGDVRGRNTTAQEIEFQFSVKYDFLPNFFGLDEVYTVAYTQHSFWQYYVGDAYFRTSDYNPEFFITLPTKTDYFKALRLSFAHKSNGLGRPDERAWNYITLSAFFQYKTIFTELQTWYRLDSNFDYNPQLTDTLGYGHIKFVVPYEKHFLSVLFRNNFKGKGAINAGYSYPLFSKSLFLYVKGFVGYGESMSSFAGSPEVPNTSHTDDYVEKIGIGFSISR